MIWQRKKQVYRSNLEFKNKGKKKIRKVISEVSSLVGNPVHWLSLEFYFFNFLIIQTLIHREMTLGGYRQQIATFHPSEKEIPSFPVLVFVATPQSKHWLGPACLQSIAKQVKADINI